MTISLLTIIILAVIGAILLVCAHSIPGMPPVLRTLCLVFGWIAVAIAAILFVIWLFTSLFSGQPVVLDDNPSDAMATLWLLSLG